MAVKMRLQRKGRKKRPFYHIVIADARAPRDGRFIERLGSYNPMTVPATIDLDRDKAYEWLMKGAQPTDTVNAMLKLKGVLYRKHLMRGVAKEALTEEEAMQKYQDFIDAKEAKLEARRQKDLEKRQAFYAKISGKPPKKVVAPVLEDAMKAATTTPVVVEDEAPAPTTLESYTAEQEDE